MNIIVDNKFSNVLAKINSCESLIAIFQNKDLWANEWVCNLIWMKQAEVGFCEWLVQPQTPVRVLGYRHISAANKD